GRTAAEMSFHFEAIEFGRIVTGRNHHAASKFLAAHFERHVGRRKWAIHHHHAKAISREHLCGRARDILRLEGDVKTDEYRGPRAFDGLQVIRCSLRCISNVFKSKRFGEDSTPAVCSEFDWKIHR